jgi:hypothetical protein
MSHIKKPVGWGLFEWVPTLLLAACVTLLAACGALVWVYLSAISRDIDVVAGNQAEIARTLLAVKEQQAASSMELNSTLKALRDELHALNEKASIAAGVTPPAPARGDSQ